MRSILALAALLLIGAAPPAAKPAAPMPVSNPYAERTDCPETPMSLARDRRGPLVHRKLGDLPPSQAFAAVDRRIAGCPAPLILSRGPVGR